MKNKERAVALCFLVLLLSAATIPAFATNSDANEGKPQESYSSSEQSSDSGNESSDAFEEESSAESSEVPESSVESSEPVSSTPESESSAPDESTPENPDPSTPENPTPTEPTPTVPDDHPNEHSDAVVLTLEQDQVTTLNGIVDAKEDIDWFAVRPHKTAQFSILLANPDSSLHMELFDKEMQPLSLSTESSLSFEQENVYYIKLFASEEWTAPISYQINIKEVEAVEIPSSFSDTLTVASEAKKNIYVPITARSVTTLSPMTIEYDTAKIKLVNFAAQTGEKNTTMGKIANTNLEILSHENGKIAFVCTSQIEQGTSWTGLVTLMQFEGIEAGETQIAFHS